MPKIIVYTKKPRRTKTSDIVDIGGHSFFLYNTMAMTRGNCEAYMATEPYLLIKVAYSNNEAKEWIEENIDAIKIKIATCGQYDTITREEFVSSGKTKKNTKDKEYENSNIQEDSSCTNG